MLGEYTEIEPDRRVAHTLRRDAPMGYGPVVERVTVELTEGGPVTIVRFRHEGDLGVGARTGHVEGRGNVLDSLARLVESAQVRWSGGLPGGAPGGLPGGSWAAPGWLPGGTSPLTAPAVGPMLFYLSAACPNPVFPLLRRPADVVPHCS